MRNGLKVFVAFLLVLATIGYVARAVTESDNTNVATPANGTSSNTSVTSLSEQYVGFYGNLSIQVRNNTATTNVLYRKTVTTGKLYFFKAGAVPGTKFLNASTNTTSNNNFSLTGFYNLSYHFDQITLEPYCGINNVSYLNTTDNRMTGVLYDNAGAGTENYFFCTTLGNFASTNGFGRLNYEIIVPKTTGSYTNYDIWYDLTDSTP